MIRALEDNMSNFNLYLIGAVIMILGCAWGASLLGVPPTWIGVGCLVLIGMAVVSGVGTTRIPETSPGDRGAERLVVTDG